MRETNRTGRRARGEPRIGRLRARGAAAGAGSGVAERRGDLRVPLPRARGGNDEFVELQNSSRSDADVSGYRLQGCASSSGAASDRATIRDGTVLKPGQHYLFTNSSSGGYSGTVTGDRTYSTGFTDLQASNQSGARLLSASGATIDGVGSPVSPCREGTGLATPTANADNSFERKDNGAQDTNDNAAD